MDEVIADFIAGILAGDVAEIIADSASGRSSVPPAPHIIDGFIIVLPDMLLVRWTGEVSGMVRRFLSHDADQCHCRG